MVNLLLAIIYLSFISLGLPDSLLGAGWPSMYGPLGVPVSFAGIISMIIALGTIVSSLFSDRLTRRLGAGRITALSVGTTAVALFGFSVSSAFWQLCLWAIPYGLGAGSVDAALNNYVALHFASRHMSWLHCMWGIGAALGPYAMSYALTSGRGWNMGYRYIAILQVVLTVMLVLSLPLWKKRADEDETESLGRDGKVLSLPAILRIPGTPQVMTTFFCYCAIEATTGLWAASYLVLYHGLDTRTAAGYASLFFIGITIGRAISGFVTMKMDDARMVQLGQAIIALGLAVLLLPLGSTVALAGLVIVGLGCAPIYPSLIHATPHHFGADRSQAVIGVQMAAAYVGTCLMPPVFGLIAHHFGAAWLPAYLAILLVLMVVMHQALLRRVG